MKYKDLNTAFSLSAELLKSQTYHDLTKTLINIELADEALYKSKASGRNRITVLNRSEKEASQSDVELF